MLRFELMSFWHQSHTMPQLLVAIIITETRTCHQIKCSLKGKNTASKYSGKFCGLKLKANKQEQKDNQTNKNTIIPYYDKIFYRIGVFLLGNRCLYPFWTTYFLPRCYFCCVVISTENDLMSSFKIPKNQLKNFNCEMLLCYHILGHLGIL